MRGTSLEHRFGRVHFVGVGGIGMCGLAELLQRQGVPVSGSDLRESATTQRLRALGVEVHIGHDRAHARAAQVLVHSSAVKPDNVELLEARARRIPVITRGEMLAELMRQKDGIAVAGSHGKTTTTSLITHLLASAGLDPSAVIGGRVLGGACDPTGVRLGQGPWLVAEADESDGSFLRLAPQIAVITNIDPEHLDHYGRFEAVQDAFVAFANRVPFWGLCVVCLDHPGVKAILPRLERRVVSYGFSSAADLVASAAERDGTGMRFRVASAGCELGPLRIGLPGLHNVSNALAALAVARELEIPFESAARALADFVGVERRFQRRGEAGGVVVVDDYAHHPAELRATLAAARALHAGRIVAVFQPHRYTRTRDCFDEFAGAFEDADVLVVSEIYAAGEDPIPGIDARTLCERIRARGPRAVHGLPGLDAALEWLCGELRAGDLVLTLGAGDISELGPRLLARLEDAGGRR